MNPEEDDGSQAKSLAQQVFEAKLALANEALKKAEMAIFDDLVLQIKADIDSLNDKTIAVRENWKIKAQLSDLKRLQQMSPDTKALLQGKMAELMQWRNITEESQALRLDLQFLKLQLTKLMQPSKVGLDAVPILEKITSLSMHLNEVRNQADTIKQAQQANFFEDADHQTLETCRKTLRPIIHLRDKSIAPPSSSIPVIDVMEDRAEYRTSEVKTDIVTVDYQIYKQQVEATLSPLFENNEVLQKIRKGQSVTTQDLATLNALVHTQNPDVDLTTLKEFYPESTAELYQILRTIVGLDKDEIEAKFTHFVQTVHIHMNAKQQRFIGLLKNHLCRYGFVDIEQLYQAPFTTIHDDGLDGVFDKEQADFVERFIGQFNINLGEQSKTANKPAT